MGYYLLEFGVVGHVSIVAVVDAGEGFLLGKVLDLVFEVAGLVLLVDHQVIQHLIQTVLVVHSQELASFALWKLQTKLLVEHLQVLQLYTE